MALIPPSVDSLPKQFVVAMRTLFDIMDDKRTGYVKLTDIENRWRDDRTRGLPKGVIDSLQAFASPNGLLTFDRFCAGLNLCLLRNQKEKASRKSDVEGEVLQSHNIPRPPSAPLLDVDESSELSANMKYTTHGLTQSDCIPAHQQRTVSMPHLAPPPRLAPTVASDGQLLRYGADGISKTNITKSQIYGPPKPPRAEKAQMNHENAQLDYTKKDDFLSNDSSSKEDMKSVFSTEAVVLLSRGGRGPGDGKPAAADPTATVYKPTRRREPRRHTLQNGIDYNVLKRMKQIEQEKDILVQGLAAIEKTREWYLKELAEVQEKMRIVSRGTHVEQWTEAQQERLELQRVRVLELNRQLSALAEGWRRGGLSLHMNLALQPPPPPRRPRTTHSTTLEHQNHLLTEEVSKKNERISVLERDKSALIRELLVLTNRTKNGENGY